MTQFKRVFSQFFRRHPKFRQPLRRGAVVTPTANTAVSCKEPNSLHKRKVAHLGPDLTVQDVQLSTDNVSENIEEVEQYEDEDEVRKTHIEAESEVQNVQPSTDTVPKKVEEVEVCEDEEDENIPDVFPYDLARKTHNEMITKNLYVAVADNDQEIAALRTLHGEKFSHIVRVVSNPLSRHANIMPSSWSSEKIYPDDGPYELRLTCPALTRHYNDKFTALTEKQLLAARNYITDASPDKVDAWEAQRLESLCSPDACENARVLIVGPTDRSVDVMAILVCYMAFLTGTRADGLLAGLRRLRLVHSHWGGDILGKDTLDLADAVSEQKW